MGMGEVRRGEEGMEGKGRREEGRERDTPLCKFLDLPLDIN